MICNSLISGERCKRDGGSLGGSARKHFEADGKGERGGEAGSQKTKQDAKRNVSVNLYLGGSVAALRIATD